MSVCFIFNFLDRKSWKVVSQIYDVAAATALPPICHKVLLKMKHKSSKDSKFEEMITGREREKLTVKMLKKGRESSDWET